LEKYGYRSFQICRPAVGDMSGQLPAPATLVTEKAEGGVNRTVRVQVAAKTTFFIIL
jgi:hypothetical protein